MNKTDTRRTARERHLSSSIDSPAGPHSQSGTDGNLITGWYASLLGRWDSFWFQPSLPHTLAVIRICCGAMMVYIHVIWTIFLSDFMGPNAWIDQQTIQSLHEGEWAWSWLWYTDDLTVLGIHQALAIVASLMMTFGLLTRISVPVAWFLTLMVCHRMTLALFGLDQIVIMLAMYLVVCRSGSVWSLDAWLLGRRLEDGEDEAVWWLPLPVPAVSNNIATRLIQLHLCVIYIFGGLSKMRGEMWFDGSAMWYTIVNYEYQSLDLTWLGRSRFMIASLTAGTIFWETFYCALVWPRLTRPIVLAIAVLVHGGIAIGLGMVTFGFIMIVANLSFVRPELLRQWTSRSRLGDQ